MTGYGFYGSGLGRLSLRKLRVVLGHRLFEVNYGLVCRFVNKVVNKQLLREYGRQFISRFQCLIDSSLDLVEFLSALKSDSLRVSHHVNDFS